MSPPSIPNDYTIRQYLPEDETGWVRCRVLSFLDRPRKIEDFRGSRVIYPRYPEDMGLSQWFELVHVKKHLERLAAQGMVHEEDGLWIKG